MDWALARAATGVLRVTAASSALKLPLQFRSLGSFLKPLAAGACV